jgi:hypothetical protein
MKNPFPSFILIVFFQLFGLAILLGQNLTGIWQDNHGTSYAFRQVGNDIFWRMDGRPHALNIFYGVISGKRITGEWADLPGGQKTGYGTMTMELVTDDLLKKVAQNGQYSASEWRRIPVFIQPIDLPINPSPINEDWIEVLSFGAPKQTLEALTRPAETDMMDVKFFDEQEGEEPQAQLLITDIELEEYNNTLTKNCHWPGNLMITIQNVGDQAVDENNPIGIKGKMTMIGFSTDKGKYERMDVPLHFGRSSRDWGRLKYGMAPLESRKIVANFTGREGYTVSRLGHFYVKVELTQPIWNEGSLKEEYMVIQAVFREFNPPGFDLAIPSGSVYVREEKKGKASLLIKVKNIGNLVTPGPVGVEVVVPVVKPKSIMDKWVSFLYDFGEALQPGEMVFTDPKTLQSDIHPEKGKIDWANTRVEAFVICKAGNLDAFDKDRRNNDFLLKSRITKINPNYQ